MKSHLSIENWSVPNSKQKFAFYFSSFFLSLSLQIFFLCVCACVCACVCVCVCVCVKDKVKCREIDRKSNEVHQPKTLVVGVCCYQKTFRSYPNRKHSSSKSRGTTASTKSALE
jgi:hypothetical protein